MDDLLPQILSFPPHPPPQIPLSDRQFDSAIRDQIDAVKKIKAAKFLEKTLGGANLLDIVDPALNSVPYTYILTTNIGYYHKHNGTGVIDLGILWDKLTNFLNVFDPRQMRYLGDEFCYIIKNLADMARSSKQPSLAVQPIRTALLRMDPSGSMLTSNHITLVKLALDSGNYVDAVPVLNKFILYFPGASTHPKPSYLCDMSLSPAAFLTPTFLHSTKLKYQEILEYFLWSAMVNIGLRQWDDALQCLESVITYPSLDTPSKIMTEAYKKWVLVGILLEGRLLPLPKSTNQSPARAYHVIAKPYEVLAQIFESGTASRLKSEVEAGSNIFAVDGNVGLVREVLAAFQRFQIRGLAQVYSKISIPEVVSQTTSAVTGCKLTSAQEGENLVRAMIRNGDLHATLSDPPTGPSILTLLSSGPVLTEAQMQTELATTTARIHALTKEIKQTDRMLTHEKEYIKFALKHRKHQKLVSAGDEQALQQQDWIDANDDDEDIMD